MITLAKWAVFLDRDGVINENEAGNFITSPEQVKLLPRSAEAIAMLNRHNIPAILITNQPVVGRGLCTAEGLESIHARLNALLGEKGAAIDAIFYCPHHPEHGLGEYKAECECRKPKPGMIFEAAKKYFISLKDSYMVGDHTSDIKAGFLAGCTTILVQTGYGGNDGHNDAIPDIVCSDLYDAVGFILKHKRARA